MLTVERLKEVLRYDLETGVFRWACAIGNRAKEGAVAGCLRSDGYCFIRIDGHPYAAHRLAWLYMHGVWPNLHIDHINRVRSDNRIENLREATRAQNQGNLPRYRNNTSGIKGVSLMKRDNKWRASIRVNGKPKNLGHFNTKEEAAEVYRKAAIARWGEFASLE